MGGGGVGGDVGDVGDDVGGDGGGVGVHYHHQHAPLEHCSNHKFI